MSFLYPGAFAGLASILLLILLSLWRQRPARVVVPSVKLWERIPDRLPPVRELKRPRASLSLLLQMLVAASLVVAMAGPGVIREKPAPRRIAVVVDSSAYMLPRSGDIERELAKLDGSDEITLLDTAMSGPDGRKYLISIQSIHDPTPALNVAASKANQVVFISDRAPSWTPPPGVTLHLALVGGPLKNVGIVDAGVSDGKAFLRLSSPAEVEVTFNTIKIRRPASTFHLIEVPAKVTGFSAGLSRDDFPADDLVEFERVDGSVEVGFEGRPDAAILAAIEANPRARVVRGGSPRLLIRVGTAPDRAKAAVTVDIDPLEGVEAWTEPGELSVATHPLMREVRAEDLKFVQVGRVSGSVETALISGARGEAIAAERRRGEIVLAVRYAASGWPARPSFPIFWANVLEYSASGAGAWRAKGLLDEAASRPGLERKPLDPSALGARPLAPSRTDLAGGSVALAALLLAILWVLESRGRE